MYSYVYSRKVRRRTRDTRGGIVITSNAIFLLPQSWQPWRESKKEVDSRLIAEKRIV